MLLSPEQWAARSSRIRTTLHDLGNEVGGVEWDWDRAGEGRMTVAELTAALKRIARAVRPIRIYDRERNPRNDHHHHHHWN